MLPFFLTGFFLWIAGATAQFKPPQTALCLDQVSCDSNQTSFFEKIALYDRDDLEQNIDNISFVQLSSLTSTPGFANFIVLVAQTQQLFISCLLRV